jgi:hypothetical protein
VFAKKNNDPTKTDLLKNGLPSADGAAAADPGSSSLLNNKFARRNIPVFEDSGTRRNLKGKKSAKSKNPKSSKFNPPSQSPSESPSGFPTEYGPEIISDFCPVQTLPAAVYSVRGSTDTADSLSVIAEYAGPYADCFGEFDQPFYDGDFDPPKNIPNEAELKLIQECLDNSSLESPTTNWDPPIYFINDGFNPDPTVPKATYQIVDATDENVDPSPGSVNNSMFKGDVNCNLTGDACKDNKVIIKFNDFTFQDPSDVGDDLWNVPINQIEYVEYDFYPISCPNGDPECPGQFYIGFYTHFLDNGYPLDNNNWYNCRYVFGPNNVTPLKDGTGAVGSWSTFRVKPEYLGRTIGNKDGGDDCTDTIALENIRDTYLLGANYLEPTIFILNMGQSNDSDNGLAGYFDNIRIKIKGQDLRVYDL